MTWQAYSVDTTSGAIVDRIAVSDFTWERALSAGATGQCKIPLNGLDYTTAQLRDLTAHWKRTIVLEFNGDPVFAGLIRSRSYENGVVTLDLTDLWGLWARRGAWDQNDPTMVDWTVTYTSLSLGTLAKRAVGRGVSGPSSPTIDLPITFPADVSGSWNRTYWGFHLEFVSDVLKDLMDEGIDIDFRPRWVSGALDWEMRVNPALSLWEWHVNAPDGGVSNFVEVSDGARMTNNARFVGEGSDTKMLIQSNRSLTSDLPLLDRIDFRKQIDDSGQLASLATKALDLFELPTVSWQFDVLADGDPALDYIRLGDTARMWFDGDPWIVDGMQDRTIVKLTGSLNEAVTVTCHPTGGA
jgi:hypothetical protein